MVDSLERPHDGGPAVEVVYLNTNEDVKFHASWDETVTQVWEEGYRRLEEIRREGDEFQCQEARC